MFTYSLESTIAEKIDAILQRMAGTSRMKDFYDIYYLSGMFSFEGETLFEAVNSTLTYRDRELTVDAFEDIAEFRNDVFLNTQWKAFEPAKKSDLSFHDALDRIYVFLEPVYQSIIRNAILQKVVIFMTKYRCRRVLTFKCKKCGKTWEQRL